MNQLLSPDDLPPIHKTLFDEVLQQQLERSMSQHFYEHCSRITQILLSKCEWHLTTCSSALILVIECSDIGVYWYITSHLAQIAEQLQSFAGDSRIRVVPPAGMGIAFELGVDEIRPDRL